MPKEIINHVTHRDDLKEGEWQTPQFTLHWTASHPDTWGEGFAQMSVTISRAQLEAVLKQEAGDPEHGGDEDTITLYTDMLSRSEMNRTVRNIQKARNAVHEPDA